MALNKWWQHGTQVETAPLQAAVCRSHALPVRHTMHNYRRERCMLEHSNALAHALLAQRTHRTH